MSKHHRRIAVAAASLIGVLLPVALAKALPVSDPVIPELDRLASAELPISVQLEHVSAAKALSAIAEAGSLRFSMEGPADCCKIDLKLTDVPLRRALEILADRTDARYEVVSGNRLRVWLPETLKPGGSDDITEPVLLKKAPLAYPEEARRVRVGANIVLRVVVRWDGTVGNVEVLLGARGWPAFDEAAIASVRQWTYEPAMKNGQPVSVSMVVETEFRLKDARPNPDAER